MPGQAGLPSSNKRLEPIGFEEGNQGKELVSTVRKLVINSETVEEKELDCTPQRGEYSAALSVVVSRGHCCSALACQEQDLSD